jgi:nifR3 family TIM-barrel protein
MFSLGKLDLQSNLFLSPLAGYTNLPFRKVVRELGGVGLCTTDLVNARSLLEKNSKALKLIETDSHDSPLAVQLFGSVAEEMRDAARYLADLGVHSIDINMGCPVRKVCRVGGGSAMMTELGKTARLVEGMVKAVSIPVTAKMRLGWDDANWTAPDLARALEGVGVAAVFVHGRTREQGFSGAVRLEGIRRVVEAVERIPVIGNGDVTTPEAAKFMIETTGCTGVSMGRGAFYDPWIFRRTHAFLTTGCCPDEPSFDERMRVVNRHLDLMIEVFGEPQGCVLFRKIAPWYAKRLGPSSVFNRRMVLLRSKAEFIEILAEYREWRAQFCDASGQLQSRFRPAPIPVNFISTDGQGNGAGATGDVSDPLNPSTFDHDQPASARRQAIPVPRGPVEVW